MSALVVDCSVTAAWLLAEDDRAERLVAAHVAAGLHAPAQWQLEMANMLLTALRRKRLDAARVNEALRLVNQLPVQVEAATPALDTAFSLGRQYGLTAYDAAYLELALRRHLPLATFDEPLAKAARKAGAKVLNA